MPNQPVIDNQEQAGAGLRELHRRFTAATTPEEFLAIAAEAERRALQPGLESSLETAYTVLTRLARKRAASFTAGEADEAMRNP